MNFLSKLINPKSSYDDSGLLHETADAHCHILPGVDDGVATYGESVEALRWLYCMGVSNMYLTPHVMADFKSNTRESLQFHFENFKARMKKDGVGDVPQLRLAAEYMIDEHFFDRMKEGLLTYTDNRVLVETSYMMPPAGFHAILENLMEGGYLPVLAHPERYVYMDDRDYDLLKEQGIKFQLNYLSLTGSYGKGAKVKGARLLKRGYYDFVGSDFHHLPRHERFYFEKAIEKKQLPQLKQLFDNNLTLFT